MIVLPLGYVRFDLVDQYDLRDVRGHEVRTSFRVDALALRSRLSDLEEKCPSSLDH